MKYQSERPCCGNGVLSAPLRWSAECKLRWSAECTILDNHLKGLITISGFLDDKQLIYPILVDNDTPLNNTYLLFRIGAFQLIQVHLAMGVAASPVK